MAHMKQRINGVLVEYDDHTIPAEITSAAQVVAEMPNGSVEIRKLEDLNELPPDANLHTLQQTIKQGCI